MYCFKYVELGLKSTPRFHLSLFKNKDDDYYSRYHMHGNDVCRFLWDCKVKPEEITHFDMYIFLSGYETIKAIAELQENFPNITSGVITVYVALTLDEWYDYEVIGNELLDKYCKEHNIEIKYDDPG